MKILFFDDFKLGVLNGDTVIDVSRLVQDIPHTGPHNLISGLIERFGDYRGALEKAATAGNGIPLKSVRRTASSAMATRWCCPTYRPLSSRAKRSSRW